MGPYPYKDVIIMERTAQLTCSITAVIGDAQPIPVITSGWKTYRPVGFAIVDASANFDIVTGQAGALGGATSVVAADLAANNQLEFPLGPDDVLILSDGAGTATVDIRWFWYNGAPDGVNTAAFDNIILPTQTAELSAVTAEAFAAIPAGAVEFVINDLETDGLLYRVDGAYTSETVVADMVFTNASGATVDVTSAGGNLPAWSATDYFAVSGHSVAGNNGIYQVDTVNTSTQDYSCTKIGSPAPANAAVESASVWDVVDGRQVTVLDAHVTLNAPYRIRVNDADRLRIQRSGGADIEVRGYWRIDA